MRLEEAKGIKRRHRQRLIQDNMLRAVVPALRPIRQEREIADKPEPPKRKPASRPDAYDVEISYDSKRGVFCAVARQWAGYALKPPVSVEWRTWWGASHRLTGEVHDRLDQVGLGWECGCCGQVKACRCD